jgi:hypothetical protein
MHEPINLPRVDLASIKNRLQAVLKDKGNTYWQYLRKYVQAKLSKKELDYYARSLLGEDNIWLHNTFIRSILINARCPFPPVIAQTTTKSLKKKQPPKESVAVSTSQSPAKKPPSKKKAATTTTQRQPAAGTKAASKSATDKTKQQVKRLVPAKEVPLQPEYLVLRQRMQRIVTEAGLKGLTNDAIRCMMLAIEQYIKRVVGSSKPHYRPHPAAPSHQQPPYSNMFPSTVPPLSSSQPNPAANTTTTATAPTSALNNSLTLSSSGYISRTVTNSVLTLQDLYQTVQVHPYLLGEDFLINQERIALALM